MKRHSALLALLLSTFAVALGVAEEKPAESNQIFVVFRGPISISTSERIGDPESRRYFAVVEAGKQKIVLDIGDDAELAKKVKYGGCYTRRQEN